MDKYYTEKEKEILINYFIKEGLNAKKDFKEYIEYYVKQHGKKVENKFQDRRIDGAWSELGNYEFESVNYLWGNEANDNLVTYVYSEPKFSPTSAKRKNLDKLQVNWSHVNNKGENCLFYTRMYHLSTTEDLIAEKNIPTDLININGEVFFTHIFDNYRSKSSDIRELEIEEVRLEHTMNLISKYHYLLELMNPEKIEYVKTQFLQCADTIEKRFYEIITRENAKKELSKRVEVSYEKDKLNDKLPLKEHRIYMDKIFSYHLMSKKLTVDESKESVKRLKI